MFDTFLGPCGKLAIYKKMRGSGRSEKIFEDKNAITYRAKAIMSRIIGGGLTPNSTFTNATNNSRTFTWGDNPNALRITGMAFGNGGHLIYHTASGATSALTKVAGTHIVDYTTTTSVLSLPALPQVAGLTWGYAGVADRTIPGTSYQAVENGNIPWDGTVNITDNSIGVTEPNTTLYSETLRIPLDDVTVAADGYSYPTGTEVQFKATLTDEFLNFTGLWGFSAEQANFVSEAGLICGYRPDQADILTGQVYSEDGSEPSVGIGVTYNAGATNFYDWDNKDSHTGAAPTNAFGIQTNGSEPPLTSGGVDSFAGKNNSWNTLARKTFPVVAKSAEYSLIFIWTISF